MVAAGPFVSISLCIIVYEQIDFLFQQCLVACTGSTLNQRWSDMRVSVCSLRAFDWSTILKLNANEGKREKNTISTNHYTHRHSSKVHRKGTTTHSRSASIRSHFGTYLVHWMVFTVENFVDAYAVLSRFENDLFVSTCVILWVCLKIKRRQKSNTNKTTA